MNKFSLFFPKTKLQYIVTILLLVGLLFILLRSCSFNHPWDKEVTIGLDPRWKNIRLFGKERNLIAFNNDLLTAIAKEENLHLILISSIDLTPDLEAKKLQGIVTATNPQKLDQHFLFSNPFFLTGPVLIVPTNPRKRPDNETTTHIIAIPDKSALLVHLEQDPSTQPKIYDDITDALNDLKEQKIDGAIFPVIPAYYYTEMFYKNELKIATAPLTDEGVRLITLKDKEGQWLIDKFNEGLKTIKENGTYQQMLENWGFIDVEKLPNNENTEKLLR